MINICSWDFVMFTELPLIGNTEVFVLNTLKYKFFTSFRECQIELIV